MRQQAAIESHGSTSAALGTGLVADAYNGANSFPNMVYELMLGGVLVLASADRPALIILGFIAVVSGAANLFGGFVVTDRMLEMFKPKKKAPPPEDETSE